ncbi:hypothetical protein [Actinomadura sp. NEAU-AAG7]|uniref:hypothetical protein n=1 Tax=Actinomadura sp. NEAU-AAG7 TaxID=2839640 RepID=UPI001BE3FF78|nr:hypothetical protein [Actinomadura sp. NEAU-AAG7]MBT2207654.1 hypothetical protein [Actinomadura sp. NEAU-AAG7]
MTVDRLARLAPAALLLLTASACCAPGEGPSVITVINDSPVAVRVWRQYGTGTADGRSMRVRPGEITRLPAPSSCAPDTYFARAGDGRTVSDGPPVCPDATWRITLPTPGPTASPTSS